MPRNRCRITLESPPAWGCGLKQTEVAKSVVDAMSPPAWGCGLKQLPDGGYSVADTVTPRVGVWIETKTYRAHLPYAMSPPAWGCGLKRYHIALAAMNESHPPRGGVD